jgi:hypothetical protein
MSISDHRGNATALAALIVHSQLSDPHGSTFEYHTYTHIRAISRVRADNLQVRPQRAAVQRNALFYNKWCTALQTHSGVLAAV